ncbi:hypothetical protein DdX_01868 [Ditylenchus destructor]|uniref:Uncharacterized protein n=1 Tax=Ditylenchus destructor TaxID=166010 RepID=A0AAD4NIV5_9BILA|nr:hypothetical protein DdX_01868 [Ditylenchus destructor]
MSQYEDALDESDVELRQLCYDAARHINKRAAAEKERQKRLKRPSSRFRPLKPTIVSYNQLPSQGSEQRSQASTTHPVSASDKPDEASATNGGERSASSSEHSSIERIESECQAPSRRKKSAGNGENDHPSSRRRNGRKSEDPGCASRGSPGSSGADSKDGDWKHVSYAFQEAACYPILYQLNQQLQVLSSQLYEMETTNVLQLKLIYRVMRMAFKAKTPSPLSWLRFVSTTGITWFGWILMFAWPIVLQLIFNYFTRRRQIKYFTKHRWK